MEKYITDEKNGISYTLIGDYYIPNLTLPEEEYEIGKFGRRHLQYLKKQRRNVYIEILTSGRLNTYLHDIDTKHRRCSTGW